MTLMARQTKTSLLWTVLAIGLLVTTACEGDGRGTNGDDCIKNDDCESAHCVAGKCRSKPQFSPPSSPTAGAAGAAGAGG